MGETRATLDFKAFDADNHYYEALDAFTRHVPAAMQPRCVQWCEIDGRKYHVVGGRVSRAVANATFNPIAKAGAIQSLEEIEKDYILAVLALNNDNQTHTAEQLQIGSATLYRKLKSYGMIAGRRAAV